MVGSNVRQWEIDLEQQHDSMGELLELVATHIAGEDKETFTSEFWQYIGASIDFNREEIDDVMSIQFNIAVAAVHIAHDWGLYELMGSLVSDPWNVQLSQSAWELDSPEHLDDAMVKYFFESWMENTQ